MGGHYERGLLRVIALGLSCLLLFSLCNDSSRKQQFLFPFLCISADLFLCKKPG